MTGQEIYRSKLVKSQALIREINVGEGKTLLNYNSLYQLDKRNIRFETVHNYLIEKYFYKYKVLMGTLDIRSLRELKKTIHIKYLCKLAEIPYQRIWKKIADKLELTTDEANRFKVILDSHFKANQ